MPLRDEKILEAELDPVAQVRVELREETLSDGSKVYNVRLIAIDQDQDPTEDAAAFTLEGRPASEADALKLYRKALRFLSDFEAL